MPKCGGLGREALAWLGENVERDIQPLLVLSMAQQQFGHRAQAVMSLSRALVLADKALLTAETGDIRGTWRNWTIAHTLMREVKSLIEPGGG